MDFDWYPKVFVNLNVTWTLNEQLFLRIIAASNRNSYYDDFKIGNFHQAVKSYAKYNDLERKLLIHGPRAKCLLRLVRIKIYVRVVYKLVKLILRSLL